MTTPVTSVPDVRPGTADEATRQRVAELIAEMTVHEKVAQLVGLWDAAADGDVVAPFQDSMQGDIAPFEEFARNGLGQLTRHYGTMPVEPVDAARRLAERQDWLREHTRLGIPALVHEECLTGLAAWKATSYPAPPAWGATFDPDLVAEMGERIGQSMRALGIHQGLAPVLDVVRDMRWGRVEECISEDPYVVGTIASAYVEGLQSTGVVATLKHFVGYSNTRAGRNLAPSHAGPREVRDVLLPPFEMAVHEAGVGSVMNSYSEIDGVPTAADASLLTGVLRDEWGFGGTVVSDYFAVAFLATLHRVADGAADAAVQALTAGIDVELPTGVTYLEPLVSAIEAGAVEIEVIDRALARVLLQKAQLGLLEPDWCSPTPDAVDLDDPAARAVAARLAEQSVVLLTNDGTLPLRPEGKRVAVVGPNADSRDALFGCYAFPNHVLPQHPGTPLGIEVRTILDELTDRLHAAGAAVTHTPGCDVASADVSGIAAAVAAVADADVAVLVLGDQSGLFGRGTSGEGCDVASLELPGVQRRLLEEAIATGTPVVAVLVTGRGYAVEWAADGAAALVQSFFPGEEGASAIVRVLLGDVSPSGRLPMSLPASDGTQPYSYLHPLLGEGRAVTNLDTRPRFAFGHGLSYTRFEHSEVRVRASSVPTDGTIECTVSVTNIGAVPGADVVQIYATDLVASITRPVVQLVAYVRVELEPGETRTVDLAIPTRLLSFSDRDLVRIVEPGTVELAVGRSSADIGARTGVELTGPVHVVRLADARRATSVTR